MISVNNLSLYFGGQDIFKDISFMVNKGDKIGLVGKNGAGKSTLLNVLSKNLTPNKGNVSIPNGLIVGYLTQDLDFEDGRTVIEEAQTAFDFLNTIKARLDHVDKELNERTDYETASYLELISEFNELEERYRMSGGNDVQSEMSQVLAGLGFTQYDFDRQTTEFSGGWRMRIELAKMLLKKPNILLLDEPTNHLDIESIIWLENWLKKYNGAIVLVSHDKFFLDSITNRTIEVAFAKINDYKAPYTKYLDLRKDRIEKQIQAKKNQDKFISETKVLINKFRAKKNKAAFAQTLITKLERLEIIHVEKEDVGSMQFRFPPAPHSGKLSLEINNVSKSYDDLKVLTNLDMQIVKGDKIAFVGKNGEGKSTLAKMVVNEIDFEGEIKLGHQVKIGYYAQNQADFLDEDITVLQTIENAVTEHTKSNVRTILGSFLFSNDDVSKKIKVLSGGERARVALCKLLLEPYNLLVMDEPTNDLDIDTLDLLEELLINYKGTVILVSHDRAFLNNVVTSTLVFDGSGTIEQYVGGYDDWLRQRKTQQTAKIASPKVQSKSSTPSIKLSYKDQRELDSLPAEIEGLEVSISEISGKISEPGFYQTDRAAIEVVEGRLANAQKQLAESYARWELLENQ